MCSALRSWQSASVRHLMLPVCISLIPSSSTNARDMWTIPPYFPPCSVSFVLIGEYIQYSPLINFHLIIPSNIQLQLIIHSNIHLQCLCSTKDEKKQHNEGNMALRIISILTH